MILLLTKGGEIPVIIAKIIQAHGVWFGECRRPDMLSPDCEMQNDQITHLLEKTYGNKTDIMPAPDEKPLFMCGVCDQLELQEYQEGEFCIMSTGYYKDCFHSFTPFRIALIDPNDEDEDPHLQNMPYQIDVQQVVDRDFACMKHVFAHCDIEFEESIANEILDGNIPD